MHVLYNFNFIDVETRDLVVCSSLITVRIEYIMCYIGHNVLYSTQCAIEYTMCYIGHNVL